MYDDICFVIAPISDENSKTRKKLDSLIKVVLKPIFNTYNLKVIASHQINRLGSIDDQVIKHLLYSKVVVADLTGLNPNVMYELGIRHTKKKPVLHIVESSTTLPFDLTKERTIIYEDTINGLDELKEKLELFIDPLLTEENRVDNPVSRAEKIDIDDIDTILETKIETLINKRLSANEIKQKVEKELYKELKIEKQEETISREEIEKTVNYKIQFEQKVIKMLEGNILFRNKKIEKNFEVRYNKSGSSVPIDAVVETDEYFYIIDILYTKSRRALQSRANRLRKISASFSELLGKDVKKIRPLLIVQDEPLRTAYRAGSFIRDEMEGKYIAILKVKADFSGFSNIHAVNFPDLTKKSETLNSDVM